MPIPYWRLSGFYAFYFATLGVYLPFWSLYLESRHFDAVSIGELSALLVGTKIIAPNIWGWIADHTGKSLRVIRISSFLATVSFLGFLKVDDYLGFAIITVAFSFFWNAALPQFEALTFAHLQMEPERYAKIRLWGSIGFIVTVLGMGWLLKYQTIQIVPLIIVGLLGITWIVALITPNTKVENHQRSRHGLWKILLRPEVLAFLFVYLLLQVAHGPYYVFFSIYLNQHHYSAFVTGCLWSLGVFAEILIFMVARPLLYRFSLRQLLLASLLLSVVRWVLIAHYVDNIGIILFAQLLHAATFGIPHIVAVQLVQQYFGNSHPGKGQALYSSISFGLGGMIGGYYSGVYWQWLGAEPVFLLAAFCCALALLIAYFGVARRPL